MSRQSSRQKRLQRLQRLSLSLSLRYWQRHQRRLCMSCVIWRSRSSQRQRPWRHRFTCSWRCSPGWRLQQSSLGCLSLHLQHSLNRRLQHPTSCPMTSSTSQQQSSCHLSSPRSGMQHSSHSSRYSQQRRRRQQPVSSQR